MGAATILMCLICLWRMKFHKEIYTDYLSKENSNSIKGIFVIAVLIVHTSQYIQVGNCIIDIPYHLFDDYIAQCIVAPFLFCSGFGIMLQFSGGGYKYIQNIPRKRFLKTLVHFDIAIALFALLNIYVGNQYSALEYLTELIGWKSIGNSTWFIFASLCLYIICYISGLIACTLTSKKDKQQIAFIIGIIVGSFLYILIIEKFKQPVYYNTVFSFAVGTVFALIKKNYDEWMRSYPIWIATVLLLVMMYGIGILYFGYNFRAPVLTLLIFTITMHIEVKNPVLDWLGKHVFSIYILQRIPMIILSELGANEHQYVFIVLSWCITFVISWAFDVFLVHLDRRIKLA